MNHATPTPRSIITAFYTAFERRDFASMGALYHPEAQFKDAAFDLKSGKEAAAMWEMLLTAGKDLHISFGDVQGDDSRASARWEAWYTFSKTGRKVHNIIEARMEMKDGLIYRHNDAFDFWRWSRQALGASGWLLGWSGFLRRKVQQKAMLNLRFFMSRI